MVSRYSHADPCIHLTISQNHSNPAVGMVRGPECCAVDLDPRIVGTLEAGQTAFPVPVIRTRVPWTVRVISSPGIVNKSFGLLPVDS